MRYLVVGGHARGVGKTALVEDVIRAFPQACWTALKITSHAHGDSREQLAPAGSSPAAILDEETDRSTNVDTSRYLAAGARRAFWLRVRHGRLADALPLFQDAVQAAEFVVVESNAVVELIQPHLFVMVMDPAQQEFKESARTFLTRADSFLSRGAIAPTAWNGLGHQIAASKLFIEQPLGDPLPSALVSLIRQKLFPHMHPQTPPGHLPG